MSQIIKAFTGIFFILLMMYTGMGILVLFLQNTYAQDLHYTMIREIEESNYARDVIEECFRVAEEVDCDLDITLYFRDGDIVECRESVNIPGGWKEVDMTKIVLKYPVKNYFFGLETYQSLSGYSR